MKQSTSFAADNIEITLEYSDKELTNGDTLVIKTSILQRIVLSVTDPNKSSLSPTLTIENYLPLKIKELSYKNFKKISADTIAQA
jgi:hypothetical protein